MYLAAKQPLTLDQVQRNAPSAFALMPHESRSARYTYVPTVEIIKGMQRAGFQPFAATQSRTRDLSRREFTKHMIRFRHMDLANPLQVGDILPEIVLVNSHDGSSAYKLMAGLFRLACLNGLMVSERTLGSISIQHKGDIVGEVIDGSNAITNQSQKTLGAARVWQNLQLTDGEQKAFADAAHVLRFADSEGEVNTPITAGQLLQARRGADNGADLWRTMNRVQENVIRGGLRGFTRENGRIRTTTTRQINGIDQDVKLNRALWMLAERMQELKAGAQAPAFPIPTYAA